ncbi:Mov34/MPN/PAD-1 family protein [Actinocrispum wychmicini]|uniref:Mov34/MPN/PAD-1 family protein n=1 Tax=Actinocrispum wychmicini TaxID=1213861 RepID=UPI00104C549D|nr:EsaB/YukD family protein [Actinocrispum wychmicini]
MDSEAQIVFATETTVGILTRDLSDSEVAAAVGELTGRGIDVRAERVSYRPTLLGQLMVDGPDDTPFVLQGVPSVTRVRDVVAAVLENSSSQVDRMRTVVDQVSDEGGSRRLDPDQSLHEVGVRDGDRLRIGVWATAGASLYATRLAAISLAGQQLQDFPRVAVAAVDDPDFPTRFEIAFTANSFGPPDRTARPLSPPDHQDHTVRISLPAGYPVTHPTVEWLTPIFHPNVVDGRVCLRTNGPDLAALCQALIDLAGYRTYDVRPEDFGGEGFLDLAAAAWALSPEGQERIVDRGGIPWFSARPGRVRLDVQRMDEPAPPLPVTIRVSTEVPTRTGDVETGGFLLGNVITEQDRYVVEITGLMTPRSAQGTRTTWTLTEESFRELDDRTGDVVGWFHTHPTDAPATLSPADRALHRTFFRQPWQVAMLIAQGTVTFHVRPAATRSG